MAETTKKISELVRADIGRKVRYAPDEDTRDTGLIDSVSHFGAQTFLSIDNSSHKVEDAEATVSFLD